MSLTTIEKVDAALKFGYMTNDAKLLLEEFATLLRQTTEGTDAIWNARGDDEFPEVTATKLYDLCRAYEQRLKVVEAENARLRAAMDKYSEDEMLALAPKAERRTCLWTEMDADTNNWDTSCGTAWTIVDGTPTSNEIKYCHGCGLPIEVAEKPLYGADGGLMDRRIRGERRQRIVRDRMIAMGFGLNKEQRSGTDRRRHG